MRINDYQMAALRTAKRNDRYPRTVELMSEGAMGLCGEAGECADLIKKHLFQGHELDRHHLASELGDVLWYVAVTSYAIGYDLEAVMNMNISKLERRYPDGFDADRSINRRGGDR